MLNVVILSVDCTQLAECLRSFVREQHDLSLRAASTSLSISRLQQRVVVLERFIIALRRHKPTSESRSASRKKQNAEANKTAQKRYSSLKYTKMFCIYLSVLCISFLFSIKTMPEKATASLARVGSRAALSFAFAFLRRAWRSGEDSDLCCDLLQESLDALRALPEATLYDVKNVSGVWIDTVERATTFFRTVVEG